MRTRRWDITKLIMLPSTVQRCIVPFTYRPLLARAAAASPCPFLFNCPLFRQGEKERSAFVELALGPHPSTMANDDPMHDSKPHTGAGKLIVRVQTLEHAEQFRLIARIEPGAVIADEIDVLFFVGDRAHLDCWMFTCRVVYHLVR